MTHRYIGTKVIVAWEQVDKHGEIGYAVKYEDGYTSWSPKEAFEKAYRTCEPGMDQNLTFGDALHFLKQGKAVARAGWNGKGMCVYLNKGSVDHLAEHKDRIDGVAMQHFEAGDAGTVTRLPNLNMRSASGATVTGWLASQTDLLAEDWQVLS